MSDRMAVARRLGESCWHPGVDYAEVRATFAKRGAEHLQADELDAYDHLMPGPFWSSFAAGWSLAAARALTGE